ncbi:flavin reductase family protein [Streptomyces sp. NPDC005805]|uniref:flavin reductase family protein n=1 Tax=Streptomyces sp. NPDC005805 TaxID=3157068 RepID=UPI0033FF4AEA
MNARRPPGASPGTTPRPGTTGTGTTGTGTTGAPARTDRTAGAQAPAPRPANSGTADAGAGTGYGAAGTTGTTRTGGTGGTGEAATPPAHTAAAQAPPPRSAAAEAYRAAARRWTTGVALLTARHGEEVFAKTVSSLCTLSLDPLLVSVAVDARSPLTAAVRASGRFAVSVLAGHQQPLARHFASPGAGRALGLFSVAPMATEVTGAPVLEDCLAWFDCRLHTVLPGGDHALLVGRVAAADAVPGEPLLYHHGAYHALAHPPVAPPMSPTGART